MCCLLKSVDSGYVQFRAEFDLILIIYVPVPDWMGESKQWLSVFSNFKHVVMNALTNC